MWVSELCVCVRCDGEAAGDGRGGGGGRMKIQKQELHTMMWGKITKTLDRDMAANDRDMAANDRDIPAIDRDMAAIDRDMAHTHEMFKTCPDLKFQS